MVLNEKKLENAIVELEIEVPLEDVQEEYNEVFRDIKKTAKIDGFRKGKAPLQMIEKKYKELADQNVATNLSKSMIVEAIREKELKPLSKPEYDYDHIARDEPFRFKVNFEVYPTVELGKYKQVAVTEKSCKITDADVGREIDTISERYSTVEEKDDGAVENGDLVSFKMKRIDNVDESERENIKYKDYTIIAGKTQDEHALDKYLFNMKKDEEKEIEIKYPKDYQVKDISGQKAKYHVLINSIKRIIRPEKNDEFAQKAGFDSFNEMTKKSSELLEKYVNEKIEDDVRSDILKVIIENSQFDIPSSLVYNEMRRILQKTQERLGYQVENIDQFARISGMDPSEYKKNLKDNAENSIKTSLCLNEISKIEEIKVADEDYKKFLEKMALRNNKSVEELEKIIDENNSRDNMESDIVIEKTLKFLCENAKIKKLKPVSLEELFKEQVT